MIRNYGPAEMNRAIERVETAKQNHPVGWGCLRLFGLDSDDLTLYAYANAELHAERLSSEERGVVYAAAWLNGVMVGVALGEQ